MINYIESQLKKLEKGELKIDYHNFDISTSINEEKWMILHELSVFNIINIIYINFYNYN